MKTSFNGRWLAPMILSALGMVYSGAATAAHIHFGEVGDTTFATVADFDVTPATITHVNIFNGEDDIRVTGSFLSNSAAGLSGSSVAAMLEPGCVGNVCASDYIRVAWTSRASAAGNLSIIDITAEFGSDPESLGGFVCGAGGNGLCIVENGDIQDVTGLLDLPANITMSAQSDVEVPEPASLALVGVALLGLAASRRRRPA